MDLSGSPDQRASRGVSILVIFIVVTGYRSNVTNEPRAAATRYPEKLDLAAPFEGYTQTFHCA
jgi:hypothetical protein